MLFWEFVRITRQPVSQSSSVAPTTAPPPPPPPPKNVSPEKKRNGVRRKDSQIESEWRKRNLVGEVEGIVPFVRLYARVSEGGGGWCGVCEIKEKTKSVQFICNRTFFGRFIFGYFWLRMYFCLRFALAGCKSILQSVYVNGCVMLHGRIVYLWLVYLRQYCMCVCVCKRSKNVLAPAAPTATAFRLVFRYLHKYWDILAM